MHKKRAPRGRPGAVFLRFTLLIYNYDGNNILQLIAKIKTKIFDCGNKIKINYRVFCCFTVVFSYCNNALHAVKNSIISFAVIKSKIASTIIVKEYPSDIGEPYYPIPNEKNLNLYSKYKKLADNLESKNIFMIGRLANYKYFNMDQAIRNALDYTKFFSCEIGICSKTSTVTVCLLYITIRS